MDPHAPQPMHTPSSVQYPPTQHHMPQHRPPLRRDKRFRLIAVATVVVLAGIGYWFFGRSQSATEIPVTNVGVVNDLAKSALTQADIAKIDKTEAYFAYITSAVQQQKSIILSENKYGTSPTDAEESRDLYKVGFDYQTKKIVFAHDDAYDAQDVAQDRCYDGNAARHATQKSDWYVGPIDAENPCNLGEHVNYYISDGVTPGGLSEAQAQAYVGYLRKQDGLIVVKDLQLASHNGKQYLHFSVDLNAIRPGGSYGDLYFGGQWLMWAFKETKLDPAAHPFEYRIRGGDGMHIEYYVDPTTKLPVYSEMKSTPLKDKNGKEKPYDAYRDIRTSYQFGVSEFDASPNSPLSIDW
jgi:hypothetical protein